ncbi:MAG: T9SS type A sorting domain-containing protein [Melioribacteraceae bacterium]
MKIRSLLFFLIIASSQIFSQSYPEVSIKDVNFVSNDSLLYYGSLATEPKPELVGDTVIVTGVVMNSPYFNADPTQNEMLSAGAPALFLQDINNPEWGGVLCRDRSLTNEVFAILDSGMVIKATVEVVEYFTTTEIDVISFDASNVIGQMTRPKPVVLTLDSLFEKGTTTPNYLAEKWEGVYVEFQNLTTSDPGIVGSGTFKVFDENNTSMVIYNKGIYIRSGFVPPSAGTSVTSIRGYIETRTGGQYGWFMLNPVYPDDIIYGESAPNISNVIRDKGVVKFNEEVIVCAKVVDEDKTSGIKSVKLNYSKNDAAFVSVDMTLSNSTDSIWSATIPASSDSVLVKYYVSTTDSNNFSSTSPSNINRSYFYMVLDRPLKVSDIQYSPFGSGYSGYNGYEVTVSGQVSADTTDIQGDGANVGPQVYIQGYENGTWSGIQIFGVEAEAAPRNEHVQVTGIVNESFGVTRIGTLDNGATVLYLTADWFPPIYPEVELISTADIGSSSDGSLPAESYEGVLVKLENVKVLDANADGAVDGPDEGSGGSRNFGEIYITDTSNVQMRLELQDGMHDFHNMWDASLEGKGIKIEAGHTFESITGILFYSFSNYKLVPRQNEDFVGHVTDIKENKVIPEVFSLSQNYPNPFNPSTIINYSIPNVASSFSSIVTLTIYDVLGREIKTLVNNVHTPGNYEIKFDAGNLSTGIYFYTLKAGDFYQTKKMMLIK